MRFHPVSGSSLLPSFCAKKVEEVTVHACACRSSESALNFSRFLIVCCVYVAWDLLLF